MRIDAQYDLKGKILIIPLVGHGSLWLEPGKLQENSSLNDRRFFHLFLNHLLFGCSKYARCDECENQTL